MTKIDFQPYTNATIYQTISSKFCVRMDNGNCGSFGQVSVEAAMKSADAHFGVLLTLRGGIEAMAA